MCFFKKTCKTHKLIKLGYPFTHHIMGVVQINKVPHIPQYTVHKNKWFLGPKKPLYSSQPTETQKTFMTSF